MEIEQLNLRFKARRFLREEGIVTVDQLTSLTKKELKSRISKGRYVGVMAFVYIEDALEQIGANLQS